MWRFVEDSADALRSSVRREAAFLRMWWALQTAVTVGSVGTLALSAGLVANGTISLGTAFLLFQYVQLMTRPLEELVQQLETVQKANGAMHRVIDSDGHASRASSTAGTKSRRRTAGRVVPRRRLRL